MHVYHGLGGDLCTASRQSKNSIDPCNHPAAVDFCVLASSAYTTNAWMSAYYLYVVFGSQEEALPGNAP